MKQLWKNYGVDEHGLIDQYEARHFVNQYISDYKGIQVVPDTYFETWFRSLDKDGDGKIDMIELAHGIHDFKSKMPPMPKPKREKMLGDTIETIKARATKVSVGAIIQGI